MQNARLGHEIAFFTSKSDMPSPHVADLIRDGESMITWWEALLLCCFIGWIIENRIDKVTEAIEKLALGRYKGPDARRSWRLSHTALGLPS